MSDKMNTPPVIVPPAAVLPGRNIPLVGSGAYDKLVLAAIGMEQHPVTHRPKGFKKVDAGRLF